MVKRLIALVFVLASTVARAQIPTLTSANNPVAGERIPYHFITDFITAGPAGPGMTWLFDTVGNIPIDTIVVTPCTSSAYCADFPGATITIYDVSAPMPTYYKASASALSYMGRYEIVPVYYNNPEDQLRYPFTYGSSYVDTFTSVYTYGGNLHHQWGKITVTADAYGTLVLPYGTFPNTLRVKTDEAFDDTTVTGSPGVSHFVRTAYTWFAPGYHMELLGISDLFRDSVAISINHYYTFQAPGVAAVQQLNAGAHVQIYPVPANEQCTVHCETEFENGAYLELLSIDGRTIARHTLHGKDAVISVSDLAPGLYTCRIYNTDVQVRKLIIAR